QTSRACDACRRACSVCGEDCGRYGTPFNNRAAARLGSSAPAQVWRVAAGALRRVVPAERRFETLVMGIGQPVSGGGGWRSGGGRPPRPSSTRDGIRLWLLRQWPGEDGMRGDAAGGAGWDRVPAAFRGAGKQSRAGVGGRPVGRWVRLAASAQGAGGCATALERRAGARLHAALSRLPAVGVGGRSTGWRAYGVPSQLRSGGTALVRLR